MSEPQTIYHQPGIPTTYAAVRFRSRLEARWAALFDLLHWRWEYEPLDLHNYIPDFILGFPAGEHLVEVKPEREIADLAKYEEKLVESGWTGEFLIVGSRPFSEEPGLRATHARTFPALGLLSDIAGVRDICPDFAGIGSLAEANVHRCAACGNISFHHETNGWNCRICGAYDGNALLHPLEPWELDGLWREAGNRVQWAARRDRQPVTGPHVPFTRGR